LEKILVAGDTVDIQSFLFGHDGKGSDDIICLISFHLEVRDVKNMGSLPDAGDLCHEVVGHLSPGGLILRVHLVAESRLFRIENNRDIIRVLILNDLHQGVDKAEGGRRILSLGVDQWIFYEGKITAVEQR